MTLAADEAPPKGKCKCGAPSRPPYDDGSGEQVCPYAMELYGEPVYCGCCEDCAYQCAQDI